MPKDTSDLSPDGRPNRSALSPDAGWTWRPRGDFGPWLRGLRERAELSLRQAADALSYSYSSLYKLEARTPAHPPAVGLLLQLAHLYGKEPGTVLLRAGYALDLPPELVDPDSCDEAFAALVMCPSLRPVFMTAAWTQSFSRLQKAQWVEFARKLEAHLLSGGPPVDALLRGGSGEAP